jgi:hypothetical protein
MNMAWTMRFASTSLPALSNPSKPPCRKGDAMKNAMTLSVSLALLIAGIAQASAQSGATMQEKMACRSDAQSLCAEFIGKPPQMNACLHDNKAKLSVPCRQVVEAHGG